MVSYGYISILRRLPGSKGFKIVDTSLNVAVSLLYPAFEVVIVIAPVILITYSRFLIPPKTNLTVPPFTQAGEQ